MIKRLLICISMVASLMMPFSASSQQFVSHDGFKTHYNVINTSMLDAKTAASYGFTRSKKNMLLSITVIKENSEEMGQPVKANITANAVNLSAQLRKLKVKEVVEFDSIYYLATFPVHNGETLKFDITVTPEDSTKNHTFTFSQQFFTD